MEELTEKKRKICVCFVCTGMCLCGHNDDNDNAAVLSYIPFIIHKALSNIPSFLI